MTRIATDFKLLGKDASKAHIEVGVACILKSVVGLAFFRALHWQVWARTEGDLHRALMAYVIERVRRNRDPRLGTPVLTGMTHMFP